MKAVLYDMDGVVVLNNHLHKKAWKMFLENKKISISDDEFYEKFSGRTNEQIMNDILGCYDASMVDEKESIYRSIAQNQIKMVSGWFDFSSRISEQGIKTALVTSAPKINVDFVFSIFNIKDKFDIIIDDGMVKNSKPDPECYRLACRRLSVEPGESLVIEDSFSGIESAKRAGCICVAITTSHVKSQLLEADYIVDSYDEIYHIPIYDSFHA